MRIRTICARDGPHQVTRTIGIIGGMGPAATADLFSKIIAATGAAGDHDQLRLFIDSNPSLPDRNAALEERGPSPGPMLAQMAAGLERSGADLIVMACNTAHAFQSDIERAISVPFISMIEATVEATLAATPRPRRVGVLAASGCVRAGLYQAAFAARDVEAVMSDGETHARFMDTIYSIKGGDTGPQVRAAMRTIADVFVRDRVDALVAGCTEVPLVLGQDDVAAPLIDSAAALAARVVALART